MLTERLGRWTRPLSLITPPLSVGLWWWAWNAPAVTHHHWSLAIESVFRVALPILAIWLCFLLLSDPEHGFARRWKAPRWLLPAALAGAGVLLVAFIFHFGNHQYGAWDFNVIVDTGWREIQGQHAYTDFITPNPPGFNLGAYYAFRLFGVSWNAQLLWTGLFAAGTFVWCFGLMRGLGVASGAACLMSLALEAVTFLCTDFWWYNNVTAILACVFLLSVFLCAHRRDYGIAAWSSYAVALALLALEKPNIAGLLLAGGIPLLCFAAPSPRWKALLWTAGGAALAILLLLVHRMSIPALLYAYRSAAKGRGLKAVPLAGMPWTLVVQLSSILLLCSLPVLVQWRSVRQAWRERRFRELARLLLLFLPLPVAVVGFRTNADLKEMECAILLAAATTASFAVRPGSRRLRLFVLALGTVLVVDMVVYGMNRARVRGIGTGFFYEATDNQRPIGDAFFASLAATPHMQRVQQEVHKLPGSLPRPWFFGPRLEFEYADLRLPSPQHWPVYYQPGTSFAVSDLQKVDAAWVKQRFGTLIFLGDDRTYLSPFLVQQVEQEYRRLPALGELQVYVRRVP